MSELEIYKGMVKKMKDDEIKQLLIQLEYFIEEDYKYYNDFELNKNQIKQLLDYITNLQQENEKLRENDFFEKEHKYIEKISIPCKFIQNKSFEEIIEMPTYEDYKSRCEKAVEIYDETITYLTTINAEYMDSNTKKTIQDIVNKLEKELDILNGGSDE